MQRTINILIAESESAEREKLKQLLAEEDDLKVIGEARDGRECLDALSRMRPDIVLVRRDLSGVSGLDVAAQITNEHPGVGVILILTGKEGEDVWHKMLRAGIRDFVTRPIDSGRLLEEIRRVATQQGQSAGRAAAKEAGGEGGAVRNRVITVTGPRGGVGKSVLATNLAVAMANLSESIALVDLNLWGGDVAMLTDLTPRRTLGDLLPGFGGIDHDVVESVVTKHGSGVSVLAAPLTGSFDGTTLSRYIVQSILEAMRDHYECTIVDTGYANLESTLAAMDHSELILVVVGTDLPRLRDGKHYLKNLMAANYPREKIRVVINRTSHSREISPSEIASILEFEVMTRLPNDEATVGSSVNLGQPFVATNPQRPVSRSVIALAEELLPAAVAVGGGGKKRAGARWFSFLH
jgi:pilus assembly protein CpaE